MRFTKTNIFEDAQSFSDLTQYSLLIIMTDKKKPNIVLIVLDTVRARSFEKANTPFINSLIKNGVYQRAVAPAPWTPASHAAMFTGQYTWQHGVNSYSQKFAPPVTPLPELLRQEGYRTIGVSNNPFVSEEFGFNVGFEKFISNRGTLYQSGLAPHELSLDEGNKYVQGIKQSVFHEHPILSVLNLVYEKISDNVDSGGKITLRKTERLLERVEEPMFTFINLMEAHADYWPPEPFRSRNLPEDVTDADARNVEQFHWEYMGGNEQITDEKTSILNGLYLGAIEYLDQVVEKLVDILQAIIRWDNTLLMIVGDHGEHLGEQDRFGHFGYVSEELLSVPFVVMPPAGFNLPKFGSHPSLRAVNTLSKQMSGVTKETNCEFGGPTFAEYTGFHNSDHIRKRYNCDLSEYTQGRRAVYFEDYKYIQNEASKNELYRFTSNGVETADDLSEVETRGQDLIESTLPPIADYQAATSEQNIASDTRSQLEQLGYM